MHRILIFLMATMVALSFSSCKKIKKLRDVDPEIAPLKDGFRASAAIGYCATLATTIFEGGEIPGNVVYQGTQNENYASSGIMYVDVNEANPLPFNSHVGQIIIAGLWDGYNSGVLTILFTDIDIFEGTTKFYGIHTVPIARDSQTGNIITVFARQDIVLGEGSDTLLNLSLSNPQFNLEVERLDEEQPDDVYVAVYQNVWFVTINQQNTDYIYDDSYLVNGGGQMAEASSSSGGIQYHAMINTVFNYDDCHLNPSRGDAFIQNLKAGESSVNLGNIYLSFHEHCDGKAYVDVAAGEYLHYMGKEVNLNFE